MKKTSLAEEHLEGLARESPESPEPYLALAVLHEREERAGEAARILKEGLERAPGDPMLLNSLAVLALRRGRHDEGIAFFKKAAANLSPEARGSGRLLKRVRLNLAWALNKAGRTEEALKLYGTILDSSPGDATAGVGMALCLRRAGRLKEARRVLEGLLENRGESRKLLYWLGITAAETGSIESSEIFFRRALLLEEGREDGEIEDLCLKLNLACALKISGRLDEALAVADDVLFLNPEEGKAMRLKGEILTALGRFDEAAAVERSLVEKDPRNPSLLHRLGMIEALAGRLDGAADLLERALELAPPGGFGEERLEAAEILLLDGRRRECLAVLREALSTGAVDQDAVRARPGLDEIKDTPGYRELAGGSLLDFADPWGESFQKLRDLVARLPESTRTERRSHVLWRELAPQGTLLGKGGAVVRHVLKTAWIDTLLLKDANSGKPDAMIHFEVHPLGKGIEIRGVLHCRGSSGTPFIFPQALFRTGRDAYLLRFHDRICPA